LAASAKSRFGQKELRVDLKGSERGERADRPTIPSFPIEKWALHAAVALALFLLGSSLWIGYRRIGWYDEILVLTIARLPGVSTVFKAISGSASSLPPFYFLLVRFFDHAFGPGDGAARIPSALAVAAGMAFTFDCARRFTNNVHALAGMALLTCSFLPYYGYEARPYALCFLLSSMGLWLWSHPESDRSWIAALFGSTFFFAFCLHYYTALSLIPYAVFEATGGHRLRRPSPKLIAGTLGVISGALVCAPFMIAARKFSHGFWSPPSIAALRGVFTEIFPSVFLPAAAVSACLALKPKHEGPALSSMLQIERLGWLFLLVPFTGFAIAVAATNAFVSRYFIGMLPPIAVAFACTLWRRFGTRPTISAAIAAAMLVIGAGQQLKLLARPDGVRPPVKPESAEVLREMLAMESSLIADGKTAIVISADETLALEAMYYSRHSKAYVVLLDRTHMISRGYQNLARFQPISFWTLDNLRAHAASAALINPPERVLAWLTKAGFQFQFIESGSRLLKIFYVSSSGIARAQG
jgi:Dolichyl-phosphate-mannose-protein mannosyltransferase